MQRKIQILLPFGIAACIVLWTTGSTGLFISNLSEDCYRCLCHVASKCNISSDCNKGYCGPFQISKLYWIDAGKLVLDEDDPERDHAWEDCARNFRCAQKIMRGYFEKFGQDCNNDGVTDCYDYIMINENGGFGCTTPLSNTPAGRLLNERYKDCDFSS